MGFKKILFISPTGTFDNGAEISIYYLMKYLVDTGHQVINVAPQFHHENQAKYFDRYQASGIDTRFIQALKWWWEEAPGALPATEEERAFFYRENIQEIRKIIQEEQIELVITNTVNMFQGAVAAACEEIPHYWFIHEFPENEFAYYRSKIDLISELSDELYSVTGNLQKELQELFPLREIKSFAPFTKVDTEPLKKGTKRRIVSVGRLTERKNQLELIKAYAQINQPEIELLFIGAWDDAYKEQCLAYIKQHKLTNITFTGNLANPWAEITDQDICVFPSALETYGLVYVESVLKGIPTILSDNPGHLSAYELFEIGSLYPSGDSVALANTIAEVLKNFSQEKEFAQKNKLIATEKYSVQQVYREILDDIQLETTGELKPIRHLANLVSTNEKQSRLGRAEKKARRIYHKIRARF
ncbi:MAG: glycosyltransferase family 4 protein [Enterococcus sp.]